MLIARYFVNKVLIEKYYCVIFIKDTVGIEVSYQTGIAYHIIRSVLKDRNSNNSTDGEKRKGLHYPFDCIFSEPRKKKLSLHVTEV